MFQEASAQTLIGSDLHSLDKAEDVPFTVFAPSVFDRAKGSQAVGRLEPGEIVFDEFQQILNYADKNVEALLRSEMQRLSNVRFIFSGSDQQLLQDMFNHTRRPFYQSTESMTLDPIRPEIYKKFISVKFKPAKADFAETSACQLFSWFFPLTLIT